MTITLHATIQPTVALGTGIANEGTAHYDADGNGANEATTLTDDPDEGDVLATRARRRWGTMSVAEASMAGQRNADRRDQPIARGHAGPYRGRAARLPLAHEAPAA